MLSYLLALLLAAAPVAQSVRLGVLNQTVTGIVRDSSGAPVPGAVVVIRCCSYLHVESERQMVTGPDGRFETRASSDDGLTLIVRAVGFAEKTLQVAVKDPPQEVEIVVEPAPVLESVTVTATRSERSATDIPASVQVVERDQIAQSPAVVADDVLRQVPTFSLFRRTSSLSSHPTTQGVSLRGIGPSGVSRTLVLLDGVPFNDPFGGWVYWTRVPLDNTDRIEVVDGSSSSLYGNYAMGGVINLIPRRPSRRTVEFSPQFGNNNSRKFDVFASDVWGRLGATLDASVFDTDGFAIVTAVERGPVDNKAKVDYRSINLKIDYTPRPGLNGFLRAGVFRESRDNAKTTTVGNIMEEANDTRWTSASAGVRMLLPDHSDLQARVFTDFDTFHSNFLAITNATTLRNIGKLSTRQKVPTTGVGGAVQWSKPFGAMHDVQVGADWRWVDGESRETDFDTAGAADGTNPLRQRAGGGTQQIAGGFVQDIITPTARLAVTLSARVDRWHNYDAHNTETLVSTGAVTNNGSPFASRSDSAFSPRVAARYQVSDMVSAWGSFGLGFRAPTLNELYRQFSAGTQFTVANAALGPERLKGGEAGVTVRPWPGLSVQSTWFDNRMSDPIANVTIPTATIGCRAGVATCLQRQNLGSTRIWGIQNTVEYRLGMDWRLGGGYLFDRATVEEFSPSPLLVPSIVGNDLAQVPTHRGSVHAAYANPRYVTASINVQMVGEQFDDDQNTPTRVLPGYATVDFSVSRSVMRNLELFFGVQNLLDKEYNVGTLPTTIGSPRLVNGGLRLRLSGK